MERGVLVVLYYLVYSDPRPTPEYAPMITNVELRCNGYIQTKPSEGGARHTAHIDLLFQNRYDVFPVLVIMF